MSPMRPKQRPGEKEASFVRVKFWEIHCKVFFQKNLLYLQFQNRRTMVSVVSSQKEQGSTCLTPILYRKSLVAIRLWRNLNWKALSFLSVVHRKGRR